MMNAQGFALILVKMLFGVELYIAEFVLCVGVKKRKNYYRNLLICIPITLLVMGFFPMPIGITERFGGLYGIFSYTVFWALTVITIKLCYDRDIWNILFVTGVAYTVEHVASSLNSAIVLGTSNLALKPVMVGPVNMVEEGIYVLSLAVVYITAFFLLRKRLSIIGNLEFAKPTVITMTAMSIVINVGFIMMYFEKMPESSPMERVYIYIFNIICCLVMLGMQLTMFDNAKNAQELLVVNQLWGQAREQYKASEENRKRINTLLHDMKYMVKSLEAGGSADDAKKLQAMMEQYASRVETGNKILDVILTEKYAYCQANGIQFTCIVDGNALEFMDTTDLYVMFGNIVDNAINAVQKLEDESRKAIHISACKERGFVIINEENYYNSVLTFTDGLPETTHHDTSVHGFGLKSIRHVVEKYGGELVVRGGKDLFTVDILMPVNR